MTYANSNSTYIPNFAHGGNLFPIGIVYSKKKWQIFGNCRVCGVICTGRVMVDETRYFYCENHPLNEEIVRDMLSPESNAPDAIIENSQPQVDRS